MKPLYKVVWLSLVICLWRCTNAKLNDWSVTDDSGNLCMKMEMDAVVVHPIYDIASVVPENAQIVGDFPRCNDSIAVFELTWTDKGFNWNIALQFETVGESYKLAKYFGIVEYEDGSVPRSWSYVEYTYPQAPLGRSMTCDLLITARTRFVNYKWQPFAQGAGEDYGPATECDYSMTSVAIFFCVFVVVLAIVSSLLLSTIINAGGGN